jgi:hypothetical protein
MLDKIMIPGSGSFKSNKVFLNEKSIDKSPLIKIKNSDQSFVEVDSNPLIM